ncbi:hypothetical protein AB0K16_42950 [Nonomuraea jabiensis]|uniref:hypothetical protein n=1 Tax=Nonomuraea jabiensis TaxID=882448 RepID=UPI00342629E7
MDGQASSKLARLAHQAARDQRIKDPLLLTARCDGPQEFAHALPDECAVAGTPQQARSRLADLFDAGVTSTVLTPVGTDYLASLDSRSAVL